MGCDLPAHGNNAQILNDEGIHTALGSVMDQRGNVPGLLVRNQGIQGQMDRNATNMAIFHRFLKGLRGEVLCPLPGIKLTAA